MNKEEKVDIYDENKNKTGKTKIRHKDVLEPDEYIIGVQAIIINSKNQILISQRSKNKKILPLKWECNGGAISSGEEILDGLIREIYEELGVYLDKNKAIFLKTAKNDNVFKEIFIFKEDISIEEINFEDGEAQEAKWVTIEEFIKMFEEGEIVYNVNFDKNDYEKCLQLLNNNEKSLK